jgi:hypothetical protein
MHLPTTGDSVCSAAAAVTAFGGAAATAFMAWSMPSGSQRGFDAKVKGSIPTVPRGSYDGLCFDHGIEGNLVKLLLLLPPKTQKYP